MTDAPSGSLLSQLAALDPADFASVLTGFTPDEQALLLSHWLFTARPEQLPPATAAGVAPWQVWLILAGRGFGKTRAGAEWVQAMAQSQPGARIALVAASLHEGRSVMIEGESGLLAISAGADGPAARPEWEVSRRRLLWPNGAQGYLYSAEDPDSLRGSQHHYAWCDELAKWPSPADVWMNLKMGLRLGDTPQTVVTTTPRAIALLKSLMTDPHTALTRGRTADNAAHLPPGFVAALEAQWGGTRLGRQELDGDLIDDVPGALWTRDLLERCRVRVAPAMARVVVGVDPAVSQSSTADACGIVIAGQGVDGQFYVLADATVQGASPLGWAQAVIAAARQHSADRIVAEANNGGALVTAVLHQVDPNAPVQLVYAARGKAARAEPVSLLYEQQRVRHAGVFPGLEDELCGLCTGGAYHGPGRSPDRADALVWALSALAQVQAEPGMRSL